MFCVQLSCMIMIETRGALEKASDLCPTSPAFICQMCSEDECSCLYTSIYLGAIWSPMLQRICLVESTLNSSLLAITNMQTVSERLKTSPFLRWS